MQINKITSFKKKFFINILKRFISVIFRLSKLNKKKFKVSISIEGRAFSSEKIFFKMKNISVRRGPN